MAKKKTPEIPVILADPNNTSLEKVEKLVSNQSKIRNNLIKIDHRSLIN
jgi:hypothetical protein